MAEQRPPGGSINEDDDDEPVIGPDVYEAQREIPRLFKDPIFAGQGMPRGNGDPVLLLPGMFGNFPYMEPMRDWLKKIGYDVVPARIVMDRGCPNKRIMLPDLALQMYLRGRPRPVILIGHGSGALMGYVLAVRYGAMISHLVMMGGPVLPYIDPPPATTPQQQLEKRRFQKELIEDNQQFLRENEPDCTFPTCSCPYMLSLRGSLNPATKVLSIYSTSDRTNSEWSCTLPGATNVPINAAHVGLPLNRSVFRTIAQFLAGQSDAPGPRREVSWKRPKIKRRR